MYPNCLQTHPKKKQEKEIFFNAFYGLVFLRSDDSDIKPDNDITRKILEEYFSRTV